MSRTNPTDAQLVDAYWSATGDDWPIPEWAMVKYARAVLALFSPQRCAPCAQQVADLVFTMDQENGLDTGELDRLAHDIAALYAAQPTVEQAKAEGVREFLGGDPQ